MWCASCCFSQWEQVSLFTSFPHKSIRNTAGSVVFVPQCWVWNQPWRMAAVLQNQRSCWRVWKRGFPRFPTEVPLTPEAWSLPSSLPCYAQLSSRRAPGAPDTLSPPVQREATVVLRQHTRKSTFENWFISRDFLVSVWKRVSSVSNFQHSIEH